MSKEELIKKWLDNELSAHELLQFQQLEEYDSYMKLSENARLFKAPIFDNKAAYEKLRSNIGKRRSQNTIVKKLRPYMSVAAVLIIGFVMFSIFFSSNITTIDTLAMEHKTVNLPDASEVQLNALSTLVFNKKAWSNNREVVLDGEAFFKVEKGSKFDVKTSSGVVTVVGTQFNVKNRKDYFEVKCFEGKVNVIFNNETLPLPAGETVRILYKNIYKSTTHLNHPTWVDNFSSFESVPLFEVIAEFERQYNLEIKLNSKLDTKVLYSGMFVHDNKEMALKAIAVPFGLNFKIKNNIVTLKKVD